MIVNNSFRLLFPMIIGVSLVGCQKIIQEPYDLSGSLTGGVYVCREGGEPDLLYSKGVKVEIENTDLYTYTDEDGRFIIDNVPSGTLNLVFTKEGYSGHKKCGIQFLGGADYPVNVGAVNIYEISSTVVEEFSIESSPGFVTFNAVIDPPSSDTLDRGILILISDNQLISYNNNLMHLDYLIYTGNSMSVQLDRDDFTEQLSSFDPNKTYYAIAYGISGGYGKYYDPENQSF
jgi:hypothetical protein